MNFDLTEDQREIKRTARDWLAARYPIARVREIALDGAADDTWEEVTELGWPDIADFGRWWRARAVVATPRSSGFPGRRRHCFALGGAAAASRPEGRRHGAMCRAPIPRRPRWTARRAPRSRCRPPSARTSSSSPLLRVISRSASAASVEPARALDPTRPLFTVEFDGEGEEIAGDHFGNAWHAIAVAAAAESVGVASAVTRMTVEYAKERKQFGGRSAPTRPSPTPARRCSWRPRAPATSSCGRPGRSTHDPETPAMAANCAKAYACDAAVNVCRSAMQVHGGIGFTWEHDLHLYFKRAEANAHAFGDSGWHREQVAAALPLAQEAVDGARLVASSTVRPAPPSGSVTVPVGLSTRRLRGAGRELRADQAEQARAGHVGADRLRRRPRDPGQADEGLDGGDLVLDRADDLLLAPGAGEVVPSGCTRSCGCGRARGPACR